MEVTKIVGIEIASRDDAKTVHSAIENRVDEGKLEVAEASLIYKTERGHLKHHYYGTSAFVVGTEIGAIAGAGLIAAGVLLGPVITVTAFGVAAAAGSVAGAAMEGGFIGHFFDKHYAGKEMLKEMAAGLDSGRGYVLVVTDDSGADFLAGDSATEGHRLASIDITPEFIEDLGKAHEEAVAAQSA